jgi:DNA-binding beta-propeller fold protein YncE
MNSLSSLLRSLVRSDSPKFFPRPRQRREARRRFASRRLCLEALEDRTVPTTISVANATLNEIGSPSAFIAAGSGGVTTPLGITLGPDGNLYVAGNGGAVLRFNGTTGQFINTFVTQGSGGLAFNGFGAELAFGPDGNLYVASSATNQVLEYNGSTGAFVKAFVTAGSGGLNTPMGITFGPDGNLYVASNGSNAVLRYQGPRAASPGTPDPATGQSGATFVAQFVPPLSGGGGPFSVIFGPDGKLYVDGGNGLGVRRYDGTTGAFLDTFIPVDDPAHGNLATGRGMAFDQEGRFYVSDPGQSVHRYDAQGNFLGDLQVGAVSPGFKEPDAITFDSQGNLLISCSGFTNGVARYDRGVVVSLSASSSTPVSVSYATADGSATAGKDYFAQSGTVTFAPGQTTRTILLATQEEAVLDGNETFSVQLSNPTGGATIATGSATVTIVDPTRQFSVADTSAIEGDPTAHYRGAFVQGVPGQGFRTLTFGPDGNLYTSGGPGPASWHITRYNGTTGAFIDNFIPVGLIDGVDGPVFHGGYLYIAGASNEVWRFNATTGAFVDDFIPAVSGGMTGHNPLAFGSDGNLYITSNSGVVRYDSSTGAFLGTFIASGSGGLSGPEALAFDPSASYLYVLSSNPSQVLKYSAQTGAFVGVVASAGLSGPRDVKFGPDGLLYVLSRGNNRILRYTESGTYVDDYVPAGSGGLSQATSMAFAPNGDLYVATNSSTAGQASTDQIMDFGTENEAVFTVTNTTPSTLPLTVRYATADGTAIVGSDYTATSGTLTFAPGVTTETIRVPILDDSAVESSETFAVILSNPVAATLADDIGVATILDNDSTKFYVVDDASPDRTFRYSATGSPFGNSTLGTGDTAPRGAAAKADGSTIWVVDANKNVYLYNSSGGLVGSWSPGGLNPSAQLEGIATNGSDIWLLDNKQDKVFKYASAASRTSGSQTAASSFTLNGSNSNAKGIVTDGTALWVIDDGSSADKVFKYTLSGSLLGSWTIDAANTHPTGLTINPDSPSDIWVVDSGTKKVYQYTAAASRTSGSQPAAASFALAATNTNPQDIADPPAQFDVVDAPGPDRTFGYGANGSPAGNSTLGNGDTSPRGAAAKADGTLVWVVDANKKVYVYDPAGGLLGSWSAGGLSSSVQVEGLASNGTDIWLLDNKLDRVYQYAGAASRLSGSQSAASSFSLASGNSNGKGIVTDGTSFWVVDDGSTTDQVYKYTLSGGLLGSWTIDPRDKHPTGLTIDPSNVSDIWIVDSGTRKVYQYTAAASRTSGSQNAAATFSLAAGNTNPQDIADPPPPSTRILPAPLPDHAAADGWMAEPLPSGMRAVLDSVASSAGARPSLASWLLGELTQTTPIVPLASSSVGQPVTHATVAPSAGEALAAERPAPSTADPRVVKAGTSNLRHVAVDQVFADPLLALLEGVQLHRPVAAV